MLCAQRDTSRYLVDNGLVVEQVAGSRKMRHIFLFNDIFICARQKVSGRSVCCGFLVIPACDSCMGNLICRLILYLVVSSEWICVVFRQLPIIRDFLYDRTSDCSPTRLPTLSDTALCCYACGCRERVTFELKWYIPVSDLQLDQTSNVQGVQFLLVLLTHPHTHIHNHFTALLDFVQDYPGELAPER